MWNWSGDTGDPHCAYLIPSGSPHASSFRSIALNVKRTTFVARYSNVPTASPKLTRPRCCNSFIRYKSNTFDDVFIGFFELDVRSKSMLCACVAGCPFGVVEPYDPLVSGCFSAISVL